MSDFPRAFDSEIWQDDDRPHYARCGMLTDLEYRIGIEGKSRSELVAILGEEDGTDDSRETSYWYLCPSFMDIWILEVRWEDDRVAQAWTRDT